MVRGLKKWREGIVTPGRAVICVIRGKEAEDQSQLGERALREG